MGLCPRSAPVQTSGRCEMEVQISACPGSFGRAGVRGQRGTPPHSSRKLGRAHPPSGKPEHRAEGLAVASPVQIWVFFKGNDLCAPKLIETINFIN